MAGAIRRTFCSRRLMLRRRRSGIRRSTRERHRRFSATPRMAAWRTLKAEYLYVDLGNRTLVSVPSARAANLATTLTESFENKYNIVRVGLNYKFGGPVVAKY